MKDFVIPLVVAMIGLGATGLGAFVGARAARFGAEKNAETVRRQVQDQSAVEHGHWLRQQRLNTYESFLEAWDECLRITQNSVDEYDPDSTSLNDLRGAAGRMAERARRIALLGPEQVTCAAEELTEAMQGDVEVSARFVKVSRATREAIDYRPIPDDAMAAATEEYKKRTEQLGELVRSYRNQGREPRELDGHPLLGEVMKSIEMYRQTSREARQALVANFEQLTATTDEVHALVDVLKRNKEARELSREQFTRAVQKTLGTPPMPQLQPGQVS